MRVKTCTRCGLTKPLDQFPPVRRSEPEKLQTWCRACFKEVNDRNYLAYYQRERQRILARMNAHRDYLRRKIIDYLREHPCVDCGETDIVVLEFDHVGQKLGDVSTLANGGRSWERIKAEIEKCEVRCANCHRKKTAERRRESRGTADLAVEVPRPAKRVAPVQLVIDALIDRRVCRVCGQTKALVDFPFRSLKEQTRQWICKSCQRAYTRSWYSQNRAHQIKQSYRNTVRARREAAAAVREHLRGQGCVDCGETDPGVLDFDHLRDKLNEISALVREGRPWSVISAEIDKCVIRCANCHRRKTVRELGGYRLRL
jgi:hypothetical protein